MTFQDTDSALVLFSGGQDSTVCLAWALERFARVETVGFAYGQRHAVELACAEDIRAHLIAIKPSWKDRLGDSHRLDLPVLGQISDTALTREAAIVMGENGLPTTFVPGRNLLFLTLAAALGYRRNITQLVGGMCETDFSGYPDCREATMQAMEHALSLGLDLPTRVLTPLMHIDKAATWALAEELGGAALIDLICERTHTCYLGTRENRHAWGYGCGTCPACDLRKRGWERFQAARKTI